MFWELIYQTLWRFNDAIKFWDELIGYTSRDEEWEEYSKAYWKQVQESILQLWKKLPEDAIYIDGEMEVYEYHKDGCNLITRYGNKP